MPFEIPKNMFSRNSIYPLPHYYISIYKVYRSIYLYIYRSIYLYIKCIYKDIWTKMRTYCNKVYTKFHDWNVPKDDIECESFIGVSVDSLPGYQNKYFNASIFRQLFLLNYRQANDSDSNEIRTHNYVVCKQTLNHLAKWLSVCLQTKWLWFRISLLLLKLRIWRLLRARSYLTFRQTIVCGFTLNLGRDMITTYS